MKTIAIIILFFTAAMGAACLAGIGGTQVSGMSVLLICAIVAFAINWLVFIPSSIGQTDRFYDLTGSITYLTIIGLGYYLSGPHDLRSTLVAAMVAIWAVRLGSFLFRRVSADGGDKRFAKIKTNPLAFFSTWTMQGAWVVLTSVSALLIITTKAMLPLDVFAYIGIAMWVIGFWFEVTADRQKAAFKADPANKDRFITTGLWARSRHPNYFGEILLWFGIAVMSLPLLSGWQWVSLISPLFVFFLLTKVSGIPTLAYQAKRKWGDDQAYLDYCANTPLLFPKLT